MQRIREALKQYVAQFKRAPWWVKVIATLCITYLVIPIDPFDVLFPWMAFSDDLFIAGLLLKLLHKYGSVPGDEKLSALQLLTKILPPRRKKIVDSQLKKLLQKLGIKKI
jgi:uncharacterized membrane protein YkvA (DUF1232 family)